MICILSIILYMNFLDAADVDGQSRSLVISNGGIVKLICGLSMPIELPVSLVWVQNFQFQYPMIDNAAQLSYLNLLRNSKGVSLSRTNLYKVLADTWNRFGANGTACVLRVICEVNRYKLSNISLFGTILQTVFTPREKKGNIYADAMDERNSGKNCSNYRSTCKHNFLEIYSPRADSGYRLHRKRANRWKKINLNFNYLSSLVREETNFQLVWCIAAIIIIIRVHN